MSPHPSVLLCAPFFTFSSFFFFFFFFCCCCLRPEALLAQKGDFFSMCEKTGDLENLTREAQAAAAARTEV